MEAPWSSEPAAPSLRSVAPSSARLVVAGGPHLAEEFLLLHIRHRLRAVAGTVLLGRLVALLVILRRLSQGGETGVWGERKNEEEVRSLGVGPVKKGGRQAAGRPSRRDKLAVRHDNDSFVPGELLSHPAGGGGDRPKLRGRPAGSGLRSRLLRAPSLPPYRARRHALWEVLVRAGVKGVCEFGGVRHFQVSDVAHGVDPQGAAGGQPKELLDALAAEIEAAGGDLPALSDACAAPRRGGGWSGKCQGFGRLCGRPAAVVGEKRTRSIEDSERGAAIVVLWERFCPLGACAVGAVGHRDRGGRARKSCSCLRRRFQLCKLAPASATVSTCALLAPPALTTSSRMGV